ncbi:MAG: TIGR01777 family protein [Flavobacteriales bacterium]|nr:MAG: TIGR01777 family protein [Flavobacteriales bacterium]
MPTILITGGSGLIGSALTNALVGRGHSVRHLSRTPGSRNGVQAFAWNIQERTIDASALEGVDHIVHLAGENIIAKRWSPERLRLCEESRTESARLVLRAAREAGVRPQSFISASGVGYYGAQTLDHIFGENDASATDAIGNLTRAWEDAVDEWSTLARVVKFRTPVVLAREGGAWPRFAQLARWCVLAPLGSGRQWIPWVHIDDLVRAYLCAIDGTTWQGAYNIVAPEHNTNQSFLQAVARSVHRPLFPIAVPGFVLKAAMGEMAALLTEGSRVESVRLSAPGFEFKYGLLADALRELATSR